MKKILSLVLFVFLSFNAVAQKTPKWLAKKATEASQTMKTVLSLNDEQTKKIYNLEVNKLIAIAKYKKENGGKKPSNVDFKVLIAPFVDAETEIVGGKKQMNKYWAHLKAEKAKRKN